MFYVEHFIKRKGTAHCSAVPFCFMLSEFQNTPEIKISRPMPMRMMPPQNGCLAGELGAKLFADAQARHAEAVVCEQIIRQLDGLLVLPLIIALARQQAVRTGIQNDRAFRLVEPELVIRGGVLCIKGDVERRVIADAKAQLFGAGGCAPSAYGARSCRPDGRCW